MFFVCNESIISAFQKKYSTDLVSRDSAEVSENFCSSLVFVGLGIYHPLSSDFGSIVEPEPSMVSCYDVLYSVLTWKD